LPVISNFLEEFPEINARLLLRDRTIDLVDNHIDLGIRFA
jgi:DNA-binding transcriptional LysR family regulator